VYITRAVKMYGIAEILMVYVEESRDIGQAWTQIMMEPLAKIEGEEMTRDQEYTILPVRPRRNWLAISLVAMTLALQLLTIGILTFRDTTPSAPAVRPNYSVSTSVPSSSVGR